MLFEYETLEKAQLIKRPSKSIKSPYIADIIINGEEDLAHCPSLGISGLLNTECEFYVSVSNNEKRKSKYTVELINAPSSKTTYTITNTNPQMGNIMFENLLKNNCLPDYINYKSYKREKTIENSRFDFYIIKENGEEEYVEIKSVVLCDYEKDDYPLYLKPEISEMKKYKKAAIFPDGYRKNKNVPISERAIKHINELGKLKSEKNISTSLYFIVQRNDCEYFKPSNKDQFYYEALKQGHKNGVKLKAISLEWTKEGICKFNKFIPIVI